MQYILIKLPNWLGDTMMLTPTIACLKRIFPHVKFILVGNGLSVSLFCENDSIVKIFTDTTKEKRGILKRVRATKELAGDINAYLREKNIESLDCAITAQNNFFSAFLLAKIRVKMRVGYGDKNLFGLRKFLLTHPLKYALGRPPFCTHQVLGYITLLLPIVPHSFFKEYEVRTDSIHYHKDASRLQNILFNEAKELELFLPIRTKKIQEKIIAISTSASYGESKMWKEEGFIEVICHFVKKGYKVRIYGAKNESARNEKIEKEAKNNLQDSLHSNIENLSGKTSLHELINSLYECALYIGNDSGTTHIARAIHIPSIILFGPMPLAWCSPWSSLPTQKRGEYHFTDNAIAIQKELPCVPCKQKICPLKHHACMQNITADEVIELGCGLLDNSQKSV